MEAQDLEWRMYGLVPYNLSPIQQGIQFGHAVQEYNNAMFDFLNSGEEYSSAWNNLYYAFEKWSKEDKTFIILNGGTTNDNFVDSEAPKEELKFKGTLNNHVVTLFNNDVVFSTFHEPDLGDQLTGVAFLVDERVWNREKYPDHDPDPIGTMARNLIEQGQNIIPAIHLIPETEEAYEQRLGGKKNAFLRQFLRQFKLA